MSDFTITRIYEDAQCTLGVITWENMNRLPLDCLERPWKDNAIGVSRIPPGRYPWVRWHSPHFNREVIHLKDAAVAPRSAILVHEANWPEQLRGCIAPGCQRADWRSRGHGLGVGSSLQALLYLLDGVGRSGEVEIRDAF